MNGRPIQSLRPGPTWSGSIQGTFMGTSPNLAEGSPACEESESLGQCAQMERTLSGDQASTSTNIEEAVKNSTGLVDILVQ